MNLFSRSKIAAPDVTAPAIDAPAVAPAVNERVDNPPADAADALATALRGVGVADLVVLRHSSEAEIARIQVAIPAEVARAAGAFEARDADEVAAAFTAQDALNARLDAERRRLAVILAELTRAVNTEIADGRAAVSLRCDGLNAAQCSLADELTAAIAAVERVVSRVETDGLRSTIDLERFVDELRGAISARTGGHIDAPLMPAATPFVGADGAADFGLSTLADRLRVIADRGLLVHRSLLP